MNAKEFREKGRYSVKYWLKYYDLLKKNPMWIDPILAFKSRMAIPFFKDKFQLPHWCPFVLFKKAMEYELLLDEYIENFESMEERNKRRTNENT